MAPRSSSAAMRSIRRELQRRRPRPLAPARPPPTKKTSATPPSRPARHPGRYSSLSSSRNRQEPPSRYASPSSSPPSRSCPPLLPCPHAGALIRAQPRLSVSGPLAMAPRASSCATTRSIRHEKPMKPPAAKKTPEPPPSRAERDPGQETSLRQPPRSSAACSVDSACAAERMRPGTAVLARTRTATLRTGQVLVLWLKAVVVSAAEGGYEVVYDGGWPRDDPFATVHVARDHVRLQKPTPSTTTPPPPQPPSSAARSSRSSAAASVATAPKKKKMKPAARPTTAGKSVRVVRKLFPEYFDDSDAAAPEKEKKAAPRPTTAGKSIRLVRKLWPETECPPRPMLPRHYHPHGRVRDE